jgi:hypothetical protein
MFRHEILEGLVPIYRREGTPYWHCSTSLKGAHYRTPTKEEDLPQAQRFAKDWYFELRGKSRAGLLKKSEETFAEAAEQFLKVQDHCVPRMTPPPTADGGGPACTARSRRGAGFCKGMPAAVQYYERLLNRAKPVSANVCVTYTQA